MHLEKISYNYYGHPSYTVAMLLLKLARNDLQGFIPQITTDMLLYKGNNDKESVLECLINMNKKLTTSKILPICTGINNPNFVLVLKNLGIDDIDVNIRDKEKKLSDEYTRRFNKKYAKDCISICPELLEKFKTLFNSDGKSDKKVIDALVTSYTYLTDINHPNNEMFMLELQKLIEIKKHSYNEFVYTKTYDEAYFSQSDGGIFIDCEAISTLNHETSHALHYYLADNYVPDNYFEVVKKIRDNPEVINRIKEYSKKYNDMKKITKSVVPKYMIEGYYKNKYQKDKLLKLSFFLSKFKEEQKKAFKDDYNEQVLDTILAKTYSVDEFIDQKVNNEYNEMSYAIMVNNYDAFAAIGDIIDAVFIGKYRNGVLFDENKISISPTSGHGIEYYQRTIENAFIEMIANYGCIVKSKNSEEVLLYLRSIVGDELVDMLKDTYENKILNSKMYMQSESVKVKKYNVCS